MDTSETLFTHLFNVYLTCLTMRVSLSMYARITSRIDTTGSVRRTETVERNKTFKPTRTIEHEQLYRIRELIERFEGNRNILVRIRSRVFEDDTSRAALERSLVDPRRWNYSTNRNSTILEFRTTTTGYIRAKKGYLESEIEHYIN